MARVKAKNPLIVKICSIILLIMFIVAIIVLCANSLFKREIITTYDLGEQNKIEYYEDRILTSYEEYRVLLSEYNLAPSLEDEDFDNNYYLASFQEYDSCSEKKPKSVKSIDTTGEKIKVTFKIYNKCGFCTKHLMLHLIKMEKVDVEKPIEYDYIFASKNKNCGIIQ